MAADTKIRIGRVAILGSPSPLQTPPCRGPHPLRRISRRITRLPWGWPWPTKGHLSPVSLAAVAS